MLNKIFFSTMVLPFAINSPLSIPYNEFNNKTSVHYDELSSSILEDIANYNEKQKMILDSAIVFKQHTLKELFVIGNIRANQKQWDQYTTHNFSFPIQFDFETRKSYGQVYNSFEQVYKDPDPKWCDPAGARWENRQKTIYASSQKLEGIVKESVDWFGNTIEMNFKSPEQANIDDGYTLSYSPHSYFTHQIRMYSNGSYTKKSIDKSFFMKEITNDKFVQTFIYKNEIPLTNKNMVWNEQTIQSQPNVYGFNQNLIIIKTLILAKQTIRNLEQLILNNTKNGIWDNMNFSLLDVKLLIEKIKNYQFNNFKQLQQLNNKIAQNQITDISGDYQSFIVSLNKNLYDNKMVTKQNFIDWHNVEDVYKIILLFLKNNEIYFNMEINGQVKKVCIWDGLKFPSLLQQLQYNNFNYLNVQLKSIYINYIGDINQTNCYNQNFIIDDKREPNILRQYNFEILYRYNALNINNDIVMIDTKKGILINSNKFVSELVSTNYQNLNEIVPERKSMLLENIRTILEPVDSQNIKIDIIDISQKNKHNLTQKFSIEELKNKAQLLNLNFDNWFNFFPNNYDGIFYAILKIENWKFIDKTNGDFTQNFKNQFFSVLNSKNINAVELKNDNQTISFDNAGYFMCRFRTNRVIFDYYNDKPIVYIENIELVKQQLSHFFTQKLNHWYVKNTTNKWSDFFYNYEKNNYAVVVSNNQLNIDLEIDSFKFQSPLNDEQFLSDFSKNPILPFLDINQKYEIRQQNKYGYLTSSGKTTLNLKVNLFDFLNVFYNSDLLSIQNDISNHISDYQKSLNDKVEIRKTLNWLPSTILIISTTILIFLLSIIISFIKRKYKVN